MLVRATSKADVLWTVGGFALILSGAVVGGCLTERHESTTPEMAVEQEAPFGNDTFQVVVEPVITPVAETIAIAPAAKEITYAEAETAFREKRYEDAFDLFMLYTARKNENPWGFYMLGLSASKAGKYDDAQHSFELALERDSSHVKSWLNLGRVLLDTARPEEALGKVDVALALDARSNGGYRLKGRAFHQLDRLEEAADAYREAIRIDEMDAWSMNNLALILMEEKLFDQALPALARSTEIRDDVAIFFNNLGMVLEHTRYYRAAESAYASAVALDETHAKAATNLARVEAVSEDPDLEPLDLGVLALAFIDEIESWSDEPIARELPVGLKPETEILVVGSGSTGSTLER